MSDLGDAAAIENDPANQKLIADQQAAAEAGNVDGGSTYPRETGKGETWTDPVDGRTITGTQYSYDTEAEALAAIEAARANGKDVLYMDPAGGSYIAEVGGGYTITVED